MRQTFFFIICGLCTASLLYSQLPSDTLDNKQNQKYSRVLLKDGEKELNCLVFRPPDSSVSPGLILVHEEWGLTDWVITISSQIADQGYLVVTPDLLSDNGSERITTADLTNEETIRSQLLNISREKIKVMLDESFEFLKADSLCTGRIAIIGFSWGGTQAFRYLTENTSLAAGIIFYGRTPENKKEFGRIQCPVYGIFGEYDTQLNSSLGTTIRSMIRFGKEYQAFIIDGGGHGFMRSGDRTWGTEDNIKARTAGWNKLMELLNSKLKNLPTACLPVGRAGRLKFNL